MVFLNRTRKGYEIRLIGDNPRAAKYAGINIGRMIILVMLISGALAGLAGATEIGGVVHRLQDNFSPGYGFTGIIMAFLARFNPLGVVVARPSPSAPSSWPAARSSRRASRP